MTKKKTGYDFRRRPGPAKEEPAPRTMQLTMPKDDKLLILSLVGAGQLSGFGWRACLIMLGVLYSSERAARERAQQIWMEILRLSTIEQLEQIKKALACLVAIIEQAMIEQVEQK